MTWSPAADRLSRGTILGLPLFAVFNRRMTRESRVDHESSQRIRMESPNRRVAAPPLPAFLEVLAAGKRKLPDDYHTMRFHTILARCRPCRGRPRR